MAIWDFVKDAGKSIFGTAEAAQPSAPNPAPTADAASKATHDDGTQRKVDALNAELRSLGLDGNDVHLRLRGDTVIIESRGANREKMEKLILAVGNIEGIAKVEADLPTATPSTAATEQKTTQDAPVFHVVRSGETLSAIAKTYLGSANKYNEIFEANRPMLSHPDKIYPGQTLRIPNSV